MVPHPLFLRLFRKYAHPEGRFLQIILDERVFDLWVEQVSHENCAGLVRCSPCKMALKLSAVLLDGRLDGTASLGQITWHHHRMYLNARIERQEPRLGNRGDL